MKHYVSDTIHRVCKADRIADADAVVTAMVDGHLRIVSRPWARVRPDRDERCCPYCYSPETHTHDEACALRISLAACGIELPTYASLFTPAQASG